MTAALFALLVISSILNASALVAAFFCGSGFGLTVFIIGLVDEVNMVTYMVIGIINHEVGRYIRPPLSLKGIDDKAVLGVGFWMLVGIFAARAISHPLLFVVTLAICLFIIFIPVFPLLCCLGGDSRDWTVFYIKTRAADICGTTHLEKEPRL